MARTLAWPGAVLVRQQNFHKASQLGQRGRQSPILHITMTIEYNGLCRSESNRKIFALLIESCFNTANLDMTKQGSVSKRKRC
jgi:hypothetical protein